MSKVILRENMFLYRDDIDIIDEIHKSNFFELLSEYGFTESKLKLIFESEIRTQSQQNEFNISLRKIKKIHKINLIDSIIFLGAFNKIKRIVNFLDEETKYMLKKEFVRKYRIEIKEDTLFEFIED